MSDIHRWVPLGLLCGLLLSFPAASGAEEERVGVEVLVTHLSNQGTGIDPPAMNLDRSLKPHFIYDSLNVIKKRRMNLAMDEVGKLDLPNGKALRVRLMGKNDQGVLMAVDIDGAAMFDARVPSHHPVTVRAGPYKQGSLLISLELD